MTDAPASAPPPLDLASLTDRLGDDLVRLDAELKEVELLVAQAAVEAGRHETRRQAGADKLAGLAADADPVERADQATALVTLTKRAALMESQVDVLEGKRRALTRYRDAVALYLESVRVLAGGAGAAGGSTHRAAGGGDALRSGASRMVVDAQEDLRREIARAMHDGPAQSLTNIVLQAQIVERLVERDPASAGGEVRLLTSMVQQTLDATKSFIFDVRPMVLDDLGLVPTLRRAARERGRRAGIEVDFETLGQDHRLPNDLESAVFRMLDDALAAYLAGAPDAARVTLDWGEQLEATVGATRAVAQLAFDAAMVPTPDQAGDKDLPPALAMILEERRAGDRDAAEAAARAAVVVLDPVVWADIEARSAAIGVSAELRDDGGTLRLVAPVPAGSAEPAAEG
jgi:two-component system, NarL family, sensor histidine kinase DegS